MNSRRLMQSAPQNGFLRGANICAQCRQCKARPNSLSGADMFQSQNASGTRTEQSSKLFATYTFTSSFSFNSAGENGPFFFWFLWVLPSCGGVV
jgi:hypothetical protein